MGGWMDGWMGWWREGGGEGGVVLTVCMTHVSVDTCQRMHLTMGGGVSLWARALKTHPISSSRP